MSGNNTSKEALNLFDSLCSGKIDLASFIIALQKYDHITIDKQLLNKAISITEHDAQKKIFWESIIPHLSGDSFDDRALTYFFQNDFGSIAMCHKSLSDEWLLKYSTFDDEPLFALADRYRADDYSKADFIYFIETYVLKHVDVYQYIVEGYPYGEKWKLAVALGSKCGDMAIKKIADDQLESFIISNTSDTDKIKNAYQSHKSDPLWLLSIAQNPHTPFCILREMSSISGVKFAKKIRNLSSEMIELSANSCLLHEEYLD